MTSKATFRARVDAYKRSLLIEALAAARGNVSDAADLLGTQRTNVYRLAELLGVKLTRGPK